MLITPDVSQKTAAFPPPHQPPIQRVRQTAPPPPAGHTAARAVVVPPGDPGGLKPLQKKQRFRLSLILRVTPFMRVSLCIKPHTCHLGRRTYPHCSSKCLFDERASISQTSDYAGRTCEL